jgi:hypothetical protein
MPASLLSYSKTGARRFEPYHSCQRRICQPTICQPSP